MTMLEARRNEKRTYPLDIAYLAIMIATFLVTGVVMFLLPPDSWFHRNRNEALCLLLAALCLAGVINLLIASNHGKIWTRCGPVYRAEHPIVYATNYSMNVFILIPIVVGIVALLFFLPPL